MASFLKKHIIRRNKMLSPEDQLRFLKRLLRLIKSGYPLINALEVMKWDVRMISTATIVIFKLKSGKTIDQAFGQAKFHPTISAYMYFNRTNGDLQTSIKNSIDIYEQRLKYMKKFQQIIRYPLVLLFFFSLLLYFIKKVVLPSYIDLFPTDSIAASTVILSNLIIEYLGLLAIIFLTIFIFIFILWRKYKDRIGIDQQINLYRFIPIYYPLLRLYTSFQFSTHLSTLLKTGMPFKDVLTNMSNQNKLPIVAYYSSLMTRELSKGLQILPLMSQLTLIEQQLTGIFQENTDMDALERDLTAYSDLLTEEIHLKVMRVITFIQPIFFIILASFIIFIYVTLMWPMFQLINSI